MRNRIFFCVTLLTALLVSSTAQAAFIGGLNSKMARFMGGTVETIPRYAPGWLKTDNDSLLVFVVVDDSRLRLDIPYAAITEIEYGQDVSPPGRDGDSVTQPSAPPVEDAEALPDPHFYQFNRGSGSYCSGTWQGYCAYDDRQSGSTNRS